MDAPSVRDAKAQMPIHTAPVYLFRVLLRRSVAPGAPLGLAGVLPGFEPAVGAVPAGDPTVVLPSGRSSSMSTSVPVTSS